MNTSISSKNQIKIVKNLLSVSERAIKQKDHATLLELSKIAEGLEDYTKNNLFSFFDIGEYFYDTGRNIQKGIESASDEWTMDTRRKVLEDLRQAQVNHS